MNDPIDYKKCNVCNVEKPISEFYFRKENNRYRGNCKKCKPIINREFWANRKSKTCTHCGEDKPLTEFQKASGNCHQPYCKPCDRIRKKKHEVENIDNYKESRKSYYLRTRKLATPEQLVAFKEKRRELLRQAREARQKTKMSPEEKKLRKSISSKKYRATHQEKIQSDRIKNKNKRLEQKKAWQKRMMNNLEFRIKKNLRSRIHVALKRNIKTEPTMQLLGCPIDYFQFYFQFFFIGEMTWDKYIKGEIVIDHIKPCVLFDLTKPEEQKKCFHYSNLQPLWKLDNLKKGTKYAA